MIRKGIRSVSGKSYSSTTKKFVTVIIPFKNESGNIINSVKSLVSQTYPKNKLEIIYVDDGSSDDSVPKLETYSIAANIKIFSVPKDYHPGYRKLRATKYGLENAKGNIIVTTDCDCTHNPKWIESMVNSFDNSTGFVAGPVKFVEKNGLLNSMQQLEFAGLVLSGAGLIGINKPAICNSANIAYRKELITELTSKSKNINEVIDESLIIKTSLAKKYKVSFCWNADAVVVTESVNNLKEFWQQRTRWATFNWLQLPKSILSALFFTFLFYISISVLLILSFLGNILPLFILILSVIIKSSADFVVLREGRNFLFDKIRLPVFIFAELLHISYIIISVLSGFIFKVKWKEN